MYAFEPLPENIEFLKKHLVLNDCRNTEVVESAVSVRSGTTHFRGSGATGAISGGAGDLAVRVSSLDDLLKEKKIAPPRVIKIDAEGEEFNILRGSEHLLETCKPLLFVSIHSDALRGRVAAFLTSRGYAPRIMSDGDVLVGPRNDDLKVLIGGDAGQGGSFDLSVKAFKETGTAVKTVAFNDYFKFHFFNRIIIKFLKTPHYFFTGKLNRGLVKEAEAFQPDLILLFKPTFIKPATVKTLRKIAKVFSWYPDYVLFPKTCSDFFYASIPLYDCHLSFNWVNAGELLKMGAVKSVFLPCAADRECHGSIEDLKPDKNLGADIVFIGTYAKEGRSEYLERLCRDGYNIKIYGNNWGKYPKDSCLYKKGCIQFKAVMCHEMSRVLISSKIALAFVREHNDEVTACRSFEIPASGAFMLHYRTSKIGEYFKEGEEAEFFESYEEMKRKVDFYLQHESERKKIAERGRERVIHGGNLFTDRVRAIIEIFEAMK